VAVQVSQLGGGSSVRRKQRFVNGCTDTGVRNGPGVSSSNDGRLVRLTFDDGHMNLLSFAGLEAIESAFGALARQARVVSFESGRPGLFAAGADMVEMSRFGPAEAARFSRRGQELFQRIEACPALTVALIDGDCFGGALDFVMSFDIRIAAAGSRFSHPGARIGIVTGFGGTSRWRRVSKRGSEARLFLHNEVLSAEDALKAGIVNAIEDPPASAVPALLETAGRLEALAELKLLALKAKNLASLVLLARRTVALSTCGAGEREENRSNGQTRDTSRRIFG
jgi:enoyl-CoA hydratase